MSKWVQYIILLVILSIILLQCKKDPPPILDYKYEYFPTKIGHWVTYEVDSIIYDDFIGLIDTSHTQLKEIIESSFLDNEGRTSYRIERYVKTDSTPWQIKNVCYSTLTQTRAERVEDNLRFIKLIFPIKENDTWKGNAFIDAVDDLDYMYNWDYKYDVVDVPANINSNAFDSTLKIIQQADTNLIEVNYFEEKYAKNVGMVYRRAVHLEKDSILAPWARGFLVTMRIVDYSK